MKCIDFLKEASKTKHGITYVSMAEDVFKSYQKIWFEVEALSVYFKSLDIQTGDKVIMILPNGDDFILSFFALQNIGAIPCAIYPPMRFKKLNEWKRTFKHQIKSLLPKKIIGDERIRPLVQDLSRLTMISPMEFNFNLDKKSSVYPQTETAFIQFSSGTTGMPKPIEITHKMLFSNIKNIRKAFGNPRYQEEHTTVSWLPLYHDMGLVGAFLTSIYAKVPFILMRPEEFLANPMLWIKKISQYKASVSVAPNFAFGLCAKRFDPPKEIDLSHWEVAMCGAEQIHKETMDQFCELFKDFGFKKKSITPVYGMAEATLAVTFSPIHREPLYTEFEFDSLIKDSKAVPGRGIKLASLGSPLGETSLQIRQNEKIVTEEACLGDIWIKGESIHLKDDWLKSGDRGFIYQEELYLFGRSKDIIITNGKNIDPSNIELACRDISGIRAGKVVAVSRLSPSGFEEIYLFAEAKEEHKNSHLKDQIFKAILEETSLKVQHIIILKRGSIPRTSSGKNQRSKCLDLYLKGDIAKTDHSKIDLLKLMIHQSKIKTKNFFNRYK